MNRELEYDGNLLSYLSRKLRDEKNLTQQESAFGKVSWSTVKNIELQEKTVSQATIHEHFENLGVPKSELEDRLEELSKEVDQIMFRFKLVKMRIEGGNPSQGLEDLEANPLSKSHPLYSYGLYLCARYCYFTQDWKEAESYLWEAIRQYNKSGYCLEHQLVPSCYNLLGVCAYRRGDLLKAVELSQEGLLHDPQGSIRGSLSSNIILYLSYMGHTVQAMNLVTQVWDEIAAGDKVSTRLNVYLAKATILMDENQLEEAVICAKEGLDLALANDEYNPAFEILNALSNIYMKIGEWQEAEHCCRTVVESSKASRRRKFDAYLNFSSLATNRGDLEGSLQYLHLANEIADQNKELDFAQLASLNVMYAEIYKNQKNYERSLSYYDSIIEKARTLNRKDILTDTLSGALDCLLELKQMDTLISHIKELQQITERKGGAYHVPLWWRW